MTTLILGIGVLLIIVGYYFYKTKTTKFKWRSTSWGRDSLSYKDYTAYVETDSEGKIQMKPFRGNTPLFSATNCPSVEWAKKKAEQVIEEDEKKQHRP